jgi:SAM-dependent methyltransferase
MQALRTGRERETRVEIMLARVLLPWIRKQAFHPSPIGMLVNPFYLARRGLVESMRVLAPHLHGRVLDVGCGQKPYANLLTISEYVGVEIDTPENRRLKNADFFYNGRDLPFGDAEFDAVLCNQVLEHVFEPDAFVREINRVLRPGGVLMLTVPFVWDEHEQPVDYARYSSFGLKYLLEKHGFRIELQRKTLADASLLFQLANAYVYKITRTRFRALNLAATVFLMAPLSLLGLIAGAILPGNADLYLDNVVLSRK